MDGRDGGGGAEQGTGRGRKELSKGLGRGKEGGRDRPCSCHPGERRLSLRRGGTVRAGCPKVPN